LSTRRNTKLVLPQPVGPETIHVNGWENGNSAIQSISSSPSSERRRQQDTGALCSHSSLCLSKAARRLSAKSSSSCWSDDMLLLLLLLLFSSIARLASWFCIRYSCASILFSCCSIAERRVSEYFALCKSLFICVRSLSVSVY